MAIQIPNPGTGNGATGDNEFVLWSKVKDNFSNQTHAASKLVGITKGTIPLAENVLVASLGANALNNTITSVPLEDENSLDNLMAGSQLIEKSLLPIEVTKYSNDAYYLIITKELSISTKRRIQTFYGIDTGISLTRISSPLGVWTAFVSTTQNATHYRETTASGANVVVDATGKLMRSTSSERYKDILSPLEIDDARYDNAMALKPIVYRSTADADNPAYHYYSFSAEELGAYDPAFTLWRDTETVIDADGNVTEQPLAERQAEGININALLAMSHAIAIKQGELIKDLQHQIDALKAKLEV